MKTNFLSALIPNFNNIWIWFNTLIMLAGIFVWNWDPAVVIIAYFLETMIIGVLHIIKIFLVLTFSERQKAAAVSPKATIFSNYGAIPFFIVHYFFFIFVQSIFIFTLLKNVIPKHNSEFNVFSNYAYLLSQHEILIAVLGLALSHTAITLKDFIIPGEFRKTTVNKIFFQPYVRIFIQQFATILACFLALVTDSKFAGAIMIIIFRFIIDLIIQKAQTDHQFKRVLLSKLKKDRTTENTIADGEI